jgi:hypothetical protein
MTFCDMAPVGLTVMSRRSEPQGVTMRPPCSRSSSYIPTWSSRGRNLGASGLVWCGGGQQERGLGGHRGAQQCGEGGQAVGLAGRAHMHLVILALQAAESVHTHDTAIDLHAAMLHQLVPATGQDKIQHGAPCA